MADLAAVPADGDVPVNPYSLMEAVNDTSEDARTGWFIFLALMTYLLVAVAGIGHKEMLIAKDVPLPIIQVSVDLERFFLFAPIVLCFLHFGLLVQHALLARKVIEFDTALKALEPTDQARHPLRLELHSYYFTQALAGPQRSPLMSFFLHTQAWLTLVALPVLLLLYIQVSFLPYHDPDITLAHRLTLLADIVLLVAIGFFLVRLDISFWGALLRTAKHHPVIFTLTSLLMGCVTLFALFVATVPGEMLDRMVPAASATTKSRLAKLVPLLRPSEDTIFGFKRNLVVTDTDLVDDKSVTPGQVSLSLRGRDLRRARLDRSDLHQADLTGANLEGASLVGTDLRGALMSCAKPDDVRLGSIDRKEGACTSLKRANLTRAKATGAKLAVADATGANFTGAQLDEADFADALLARAAFSTAHLERAELTSAQAFGADFQNASLQGVDFFGANLMGADFTNAGLQGAVFRFTNLQAANLAGAELDAADFTSAKLIGADLSGARLFGADLKGASVWQTLPPMREMIELADLSDLQLKPLEDSELASLKSTADKLDDPDARLWLTGKLATLLDPGLAQRWRGSSDHAAWRELQGSNGRLEGEPYRSQITGFLGGLSCRIAWSNGSVATGVVKRVLGSRFKGSVDALQARLTATGEQACPAAKAMSQRALRDLAVAVDNAKGLQTAGAMGQAASGQPAPSASSAPLVVPGPVPVGQR